MAILVFSQGLVNQLKTLRLTYQTYITELYQTQVSPPHIYLPIFFVDLPSVWAATSVVNEAPSREPGFALWPFFWVPDTPARGKGAGGGGGGGRK